MTTQTDAARVVAMQAETIATCARINQQEMKMTLAETFAALCAKHDLTALSVHFSLVGEEKRAIHYAYAHWDGAEKCASVFAETPELALAATIEKANAMRSVAVDVPALEMERAA